MEAKSAAFFLLRFRIEKLDLSVSNEAFSDSFGSENERVNQVGTGSRRFYSERRGCSSLGFERIWAESPVATNAGHG
jgi:hypothetical protein